MPGTGRPKVILETKEYRDAEKKLGNVVLQCNTCKRLSSCAEMPKKVMGNYCNRHEGYHSKHGECNGIWKFIDYDHRAY